MEWLKAKFRMKLEIVLLPDPGNADHCDIFSSLLLNIIYKLFIFNYKNKLSCWFNLVSAYK